VTTPTVKAMQAWTRSAGCRPWAPTLVLHGSEDGVIVVGNAQVLASRIPSVELAIIEGAGHVYHSEQAEVADPLVLDFVRRHRDD
jgi:pimeloyl-ACP methyl ester carboxylesterase